MPGDITSWIVGRCTLTRFLSRGSPSPALLAWLARSRSEADARLGALAQADRCQIRGVRVHAVDRHAKFLRELARVDESKRRGSGADDLHNLPGIAAAIASASLTVRIRSLTAHFVQNRGSLPPDER